jgi:predicted nucleic acid-binding Zn finger protein
MAFLKSLKKAEEDGKHFKLLEIISICPTTMKFVLTGKTGTEYTVEICSKPICSCPFFTHHSLGKKKIPCKHMIWIMTSVLKISKQSNLLQQVGLIESEIKEILKDAPAEGNYRQVPASNDGQSTTETPHSISLTSEEMESIFESKKATEPKQIWKVAKRETRVNASCCTCKSTMPGGKIYIVVNGLYIPRNQKFAVSHQFYFCADLRCVAIKPFASNIETPPREILQDSQLQLSSEDICLLRSRGLPIKN